MGGAGGAGAGGPAGFRTRVPVVVTTRTAPAVTADEWADRYRARWQAELDLRSVKGTPGLDVLRCQTPAMVRKEVWAPLRADHLIRTARAQVAESAGRHPRELSVAATVPALAAFAEVLDTAAGYAAFVRVVRYGSGGAPPGPGGTAGPETPTQTVPAAIRPARRRPKTTPRITLTLQEVPFGLRSLSPFNWATSLYPALTAFVNISIARVV